MSTEEGCASISDSLGQLLFYTDGVKVYNRQNQVMPNGTGLMGHTSAANSAIVIPQPGSNTVYYIFTADAVDNSLSNGYRYSIVDMSLNGGLGDVTSTKNILLYAKCTERLTAASHANGIDIWVITKEWDSDRFKVYKVDCNGLDPNPVISSAGVPTLYNGSYNDGIGCTKVSPDGTKLAATRIAQNGWELFDFNDATGVISGAIFIPLQYDRVYGVEFSPNSQLVYIATECCSSAGSVHQYKVDVHDSATIKNSMYLVDSSKYYKTALQLGPDGRIYVPNSGDSTLNVIIDPDNYGQGCNYFHNLINLTNSKIAFRGLPVFLNRVVNNNSVDFTTVTPVCNTMIFTGTTSLPPPLEWSWDFGDGKKGTGQTITHVFPADSNFFDVTVQVKNPNLCGAVATKMKIAGFVRIVPFAYFDISYKCGDYNVQFIDRSQISEGFSLAGWEWDFGDGQTSTTQFPIHTYASNGQYTVRLITMSDGCLKDTTFKTITITSKPVSNFSSGYGCSNAPIQFTDQSTIAAGNVSQWSWNFGDGGTSSVQNPVHSYNTNGNYLVTMVSIGSNGCVSDTIRRNVIITSKPLADFSFSPGCVGSAVRFRDNSTISSGIISTWFWDRGNNSSAITQNDSIVYPTAGNFLVKHVVTSDGGCPSDTISKLVSIEPKPTSDFIFTSLCGSKTILFADQTKSPGVTSWQWFFGDGQSSTSQNPQHTYPNFGSYGSKLITSTKNGCQSDTLYKTLMVRAKPTVDFTLPAVCLLDASADFINSSVIADNTALLYHWSFGDINALPTGSDTSNKKDPSHKYSATGIYDVKVIATSITGCSDSVSKSFTVNGAVPEANFKVINQNTLCSNIAVQIKDSSSVDFGNITRLRIFWGDGDSTVDTSPGQAASGKLYNHSYAAFNNPIIKNYTITVYSYSGIVCESAMSKTITLFAAPQIQFDPLQDVCQEVGPFTITNASEQGGLAGQGSYSGVGITDQIAGIFNPKLADTGNHLITYRYITSQGCRADSVQTLRVNPSPVASFSFVDACLPNALINFKNASTLPGSAGQLQYNWDFGDPNSTVLNPTMSSLVNPSHIFTTLDTFEVKLVATSTEGCIDDTSMEILPNKNIIAPPVAKFKLDSSGQFCEGLPVAFTNTSDKAASLTKWWWNFGDGIVDSVSRTPSHSYTAGNYLASLQVQDEKGCISSVTTDSISVETVPVANFTTDTTCLGKSIQFHDGSTNVIGSIATWNWDFDDGNLSSIQNPQHVYTGYKNYEASLEVTTTNGCSSVIKKVIAINHVNISAGHDTVASVGQPIQLLAQGAISFTWSPSIGLNNPNISNPIATLQGDQTYYLKGITEAGCIGYDTLHVSVFERADIYVPTAFTPNYDGRNDLFGPVCVGIKSLDYFTVYNRWGQIVFTTKKLNGKWDGKLNGMEQSTATFVWIVKGITYEGKLIEKKGPVTLIR